MKGRGHLVLAGALVVLGVALLASEFLFALEMQAMGLSEGDEAPIVSALWDGAFLGFLAVGALVAVKRPRNPIGWMFLVLPLAMWSPVSDIALLSRSRGEPVPTWAVELEWYFHGTGTPSLVLFAIFVLVAFPNAELTRLGRRVLRAAVPMTAVLVLVRLVAPAPMDGSGLPNPHAISGSGDASGLLQLLGELVALAILPAAWDLVRRYRRSRGAERQQFRWVVRSMVFAPVGFLVVVPLGESLLSEELSQYTDLVGIWLAVGSISAGFGVSILRYRLWDIDRVVSRTVSYVLVMLLLVAVYLGSVLTIQAVARPLAGDSDLAVAVSTLVAAALFQPLRRRVTSVVDRRFNRSRYDAARTVASLAERLRDEVDLATLRQELVGAAGSALHPSSVTLHLVRPTGSG